MNEWLLEMMNYLKRWLWLQWQKSVQAEQNFSQNSLNRRSRKSLSKCWSLITVWQLCFRFLSPPVLMHGGLLCVLTFTNLCQTFPKVVRLVRNVQCTSETLWQRYFWRQIVFLKGRCLEALSLNVCGVSWYSLVTRNAMFKSQYIIISLLIMINRNTR